MRRILQNLACNTATTRIDFKYLETLKDREHSENMLGIHIGSLFGNIRNWCGVEGISYLYAMTRISTKRLLIRQRQPLLPGC